MLLGSFEAISSHTGITKGKPIVIAHAEYFYVNSLSAIFEFCIYQSYFISESRTKKIDIVNM